MHLSASDASFQVVRHVIIEQILPVPIGNYRGQLGLGHRVAWTLTATAQWASIKC